MMENRLDQLKPGESGVIARMAAEGQLRSRLMDMGLIKGTQVTMVRKAPLGDPLEIEVKGYSLSLRKQEASLIYLEPAS